jgi:hypothetical protein
MARTRKDGSAITLEGLCYDIMDVAGHSAEGFELTKDLRSLLTQVRSEAFDSGMALGARVEHRVAVEALQQAALKVLGKDRGDGGINLGVLGEDVFAEG